MTNSIETSNVVKAVDHSAIRMQFDTGALVLNGESPDAVLAENARLIGHVHASEPELMPLGDGGVEHRLFCTALLRHIPEHVVSIEMVATQNEPHLHAIERALCYAVNCYRQDHGAI